MLSFFLVEIVHNVSLLLLLLFIETIPLIGDEQYCITSSTIKLSSSFVVLISLFFFSSSSLSSFSSFSFGFSFSTSISLFMIFIILIKKIIIKKLLLFF